MKEVRPLLDPNRKGREAEELETRVRQLVIGQDDAVIRTVEAYQTFLSGMSPAGRAAGNSAAFSSQPVSTSEAPGYCPARNSV
jgi:hypothetical protein